MRLIFRGFTKALDAEHATKVHWIKQNSLPGNGMEMTSDESGGD